ncbi:MAG TPA: IclR family transcriptional regulator [Gammaproteobacteria bacterium]|nr:IclR family transcriptional regulator [Gammaproteobacteria bacterium]
MSDTKKTDKSRNFVTALARGLDILRAFEPGYTLLGNQELAERTGLPRPTISRLTYTLTELGYLSYNARLAKYSPAAGVLSLGYACLASFGVRQVARPMMQELAQELDISVALGTRDRLQMIYLENCQGQGALTIRLDIGSRIPLATTAMGRALLAVVPEVERAYLLDRMRRHFGAEWDEVKAGIEAAVEEYSLRGYVSSRGDWSHDVNAVGVPLVLPDSTVVAFNCGGPSFLLNQQRLDEELGPRLRSMVHSVSRILSRV